MENLEQILESSIELDEKLLAMNDVQLAEMYEGSGEEYLNWIRADLKSRIILCQTLLPCKESGLKLGEELEREINTFHNLIAKRVIAYPVSEFLKLKLEPKKEDKNN